MVFVISTGLTFACLCCLRSTVLLALPKYDPSLKSRCPNYGVRAPTPPPIGGADLFILVWLETLCSRVATNSHRSNRQGRQFDFSYPPTDSYVGLDLDNLAESFSGSPYSGESSSSPVFEFGCFFCFFREGEKNASFLSSLFPVAVYN